MLYPGNGKALFEQLKDTIIQKIAEGEYKKGDKLPSERELSKMYGISRVTVRQSLNELVQSGVIVKKQGKGNFVATKRIEHKLDSLLGFVEEFSSKKMTCEVSLIKKEFVVVPLDVAEAMQVTDDYEMFMIVRKIIVDEQSLGIDYTYVPKNIAYLLEGLNFQKDILYRFLEKSGYKLSTADQVITAENPTAEEAILLNQKVNKPALVINRTAYVEGGRPIVYSKTIYLADRYQYKLSLKRYPVTFDV